MTTPKERAQNTLYNYLDRAANSPYGANFNQDNRTEINNIINDIISAAVEQVEKDIYQRLLDAQLTIQDHPGK